MNRIESIVSFINSNDIVADIGCDQAEVGIMLAKQKINSIACDISDKVIFKAKNKIKKLNYEKYIDLRVGNGLQSLKIEDNVNTVILAGMGTHTILNILNNSCFSFDKIITISNNHHDLLRKEMNLLNYKVLFEKIIYERKKYYNLIVFDKGNYEYNEKELLFGINHVNTEELIKWKKYLYNKYSKIQLSSKEKNCMINNMLNILKSDLH